MGQFRFDAQAINHNVVMPITPRPMEHIYVPSKVAPALDPITDVSECASTERTNVSSAMTGTCSNGTSALHREDDEMEPDHNVEGISQMTQHIADMQLNAEVPAFMPTNNHNNNNGPMMVSNQQMSNTGFVASSYIPFGLSGLPHPSQFATLPQMQPMPTPPTMIMNAPNTAATAVQGSNYYMDATQPQTQRGSP